jgi:hypothetical protein
MMLVVMVLPLFVVAGTVAGGSDYFHRTGENTFVAATVAEDLQIHTLAVWNHADNHLGPNYREVRPHGSS